MRTVHETEALRPSDPVPKHHSSNPQNKTQRLRITLGGKMSKENGKEEPATQSPTSPMTAAQSEFDDPNDIFYTRDTATDTWLPNFPSDITFTARELDLPAKELASLLQYQVEWALETSESLKKQEDLLNEKRELEALTKNVLMRDYIAWSERRLAEKPSNGHIAIGGKTDAASLGLDSSLPPFPYAAASIEDEGSQMDVDSTNGRA
jgi:hypothetical protein